MEKEFLFCGQLEIRTADERKTLRKFYQKLLRQFTPHNRHGS